MQYIDNDMDELFNKAGRDYPLKTDNGNWDAVFGRLQQPDPAIVPLNPKTNRKYYWLLLLLLLPLSYLLIGDNKEIKNNTGDKIITEDVKKTSPSSMSENKTVDRSKGVKNSISNTEGNPVAGNTNTKQAPAKNFIARKTTGSKPLVENNVEENVVQAPLRSERIQSERTQSFHLILPYYELSPYTINPPPFENQSSPSPAPEKPKKKKASGLYAGLLAGPDLSTVKYQKMEKAGFSIGVLAGYKFSSRWSIEAGVLYDRKKYYTDGKYFDKAKTNIPPSVMIAYLDGVCEMFEVPVSVRYNFSAKENTLFATAGFTSYFMNQEKYDYWAYSGGSWYDGYRSYDNSGNHFFSNMHLSVGYNYKMSKKFNLRIEPYIKIPVSNVGIGNLPISSTGIYFGIMRNIR